MTGCIRDLSVSGRKAYLLSESNSRVQAATKCFRSVEPGYYFEKGLLAHEIKRGPSSNRGGGRGDSSRLDIELDFRTVKDGILMHTIGDQTDLFLSLNQGQVGGGSFYLRQGYTGQWMIFDTTELLQGGAGGLAAGLG